MAYATTADLTAAWPSDAGPVPADAARLLEAASDLLDTTILLSAAYCTDDAGAPTDPIVVEALRDAVCAQVRWWDETGDELGSAGTVQSVSIGSVSLTRAATAGPGGGGGGTLAPQVGRILRRPRLACRLVLGVIGGARW